MGLTAGVLRQMARQLELDVDEAAMAGRGQSQEARDAFWVAANRAVLEAIRTRQWHRLARLYEAQSEIQRVAGEPFMKLLAMSFEADLNGTEADVDALGMGVVTIIGDGCGACDRDAGAVVDVADERLAPRLPHRDCQGLRCTCMYTIGASR